MRIKKNTIIHPLPKENLILEFEEDWEVKLPEDYRDFVKRYGGGEPAEAAFDYNGHSYMIERFLCLLEDPDDVDDLGWYDIDVVRSQVSWRLTANEDLIGAEMLPIAETKGDVPFLSTSD